jgi:hypothetical protein
MKIDKQSNGYVDYSLFKDAVSSKEEAISKILLNFFEKED